MSIKKAVRAAVAPIYYNIMSMLPPRMNVTLGYLRAHGRLPDLKNPRSFNEKIIWRKLYEHDARFPDLVDKIKAKEIMVKKFGPDFVIPTLAVYDRAENLDFTKPPLSQPPYVLKVNHGAKMNIFVRDKSFDPEAIRKKLAGYLKEDHGVIRQEWAYSQIDRKILVEPYVEVPDGYLTDYKIHVFGGTVFAIEMIVDRFGTPKDNIYDRDWNFLDFVYGYPHMENNIPPPPQLKEMVDYAEAIGKDFSYVRVDLYIIDQKVKFGELTFYPGAGNDPFDPVEWDYKFGDQWKLKLNN